MNRYTTNGEEGEILPNLLGITDEETLHNAEFEGFLMAEILFTEKLTAQDKFSVKYICDIHRTALKMNSTPLPGVSVPSTISKADRVSGRKIYPDSMRIFEEEILSQLPDHYTSQQALIKDIAKVHGELLFIHPFREGNGRTSRILANLMARKQGYPGLNFKRIDFNEYIIAVQQVARKDYSRMEQIIAYTF